MLEPSALLSVSPSFALKLLQGLVVTLGHLGVSGWGERGQEE